MDVLILDQKLSDDSIAKRRELGHDLYDEVWEGVYVMAPMPNNMHQDVATDLAGAIGEVIRVPGLGRVQAGANVSGLNADWEHDYRCPDVVVVLNGSRAIDRKTHWQGGPDFLVEIRSPRDDTFKKLPFYAALGVREVLVVERDSRETTLYRLGRTRLTPVKPTDIDGDTLLVSRVLPLAFRTVTAKKLGPRLEVRRTAGRKKTWLI